MSAELKAPTHASRSRPEVRRRFAPHQLHHAHAVELLHEGIPLPLIQRQLGHSHPPRPRHLSTGALSDEIISTVHIRARRWCTPAPARRVARAADAHDALTHTINSCRPEARMISSRRVRRRRCRVVTTPGSARAAGSSRFVAEQVPRDGPGIPGSRGWEGGQPPNATPRAPLCMRQGLIELEQSGGGALATARNPSAKNGLDDTFSLLQSRPCGGDASSPASGILRTEAEASDRTRSRLSSSRGSGRPLTAQRARVGACALFRRPASACWCSTRAATVATAGRTAGCHAKMASVGPPHFAPAGR